MPSKLQIVLAAAVTFAAAQARAQISLSSAVDLAFHADPKVLSAQAEVDRSRAALSESKDVYVPVITTAGGIGPSVGVPLGLPVIFSVNAQSLAFNWSQRDYIRAAHSGWDAAHFALEQAQDDAAEDVVTTYLQLDNASARRLAAQQALDHAQHLLSIVQDRVTAGTDAHIEVPRADLTVTQLQQQLAHIDSEIAELSTHLADLTGLKGVTPTAVHDSIPPLPSTAALTSGTMPPPTSNPGVEAAFAQARARWATARGDARYLYRPQISFGANYSRITTALTNYKVYYPGFDPDKHPDISYNALYAGVNISIPLLDLAHHARARESAADARKAQADAVNAQILFTEGRLKLQRAASDLEFSERIAQDHADIAQDELGAVLIQLAPSAAPPAGQPALTPKDEQNARLQLAQKQLDVLTSQQQLTQAKISLMRQTGQLAPWVHSAISR
jgi:outer membrane protein TolC